MKRRRLVLFAIVLSTILVFIGNVNAGSVTVATFSDPSGEASSPLFKVDWANSLINGGWADSQNNLDLQIVLPGANAVFADAWFIMDPLVITSTIIFGGQKWGTTDSGQIRFYADGTSTNPVLIIDFLAGFIGRQFLAAEEQFAANTVVITGSAIPYALSYEQFSFSFANVTNFNVGDGFTSTASFTSSAVVPEPATLCLLGLGSLLIIRKKHK